MSRWQRMVLLALSNTSSNSEEMAIENKDDWDKVLCSSNAEKRGRAVNEQESASVLSHQPEWSPLVFPEGYRDDSDDSVADKDYVYCSDEESSAGDDDIRNSTIQIGAEISVIINVPANCDALKELQQKN
nr:unnamed protein product [Callosobruchus chinensis]